MSVFTKCLAFILLLIWAIFTILLIVTIIPVILLGSEVGIDKWDDWFCGGKQLLQAVLK
jgi:hypothetical protein